VEKRRSVSALASAFRRTLRLSRLTPSIGVSRKEKCNRDEGFFSDHDHENADDYNFDHPSALDFDLAFEKI
jgi:uridine kinase